MDQIDRYYRTSVLPFAAFVVIGSGVLLPAFAFSNLPISYCPFFDDPRTQRALLAGIAATQLLLGLGLMKKWRIAYFGYLAHLILGTGFLTCGLMLDPPHHLHGSEAVWIALFGTLVNGLVAIWLWSARPVFGLKSANARPS